MTIFTKSTKDSLKRDVGKRGGMCLTCSRNGKELLMGMENGAAMLENILAVPPKVGQSYPLNQSSPLLAIDPGEMRTCVYPKTWA